MYETNISYWSQNQKILIKRADRSEPRSIREQPAHTTLHDRDRNKANPKALGVDSKWTYGGIL
jgi:hypothetical protein